MDTSELDYELPPGLIAQRPLERRDESRLLVYERATGAVRHRSFGELPDELGAETLTVVNDTRVLPARLRLRRPGGGEAEGLLLERLGAKALWGGARVERPLGRSGAPLTATEGRAATGARRAGRVARRGPLAAPPRRRSC